MRRWLAPLCALAVASTIVWPAVAAKPPARTDAIWLAPDFASFDVRSIAMLPVATFDNNIEARRAVETALGQSLRGTGYRWTSTLVTRDQIARDGGDSLAAALTQGVLKTGRVDSLDAPRLSRATHARALFTVRVDRFERMELQFDQSGKPTTTVQLTAALVDSTGRLLWSASGNETAEGPYQDANEASLGVRASGLNNTPIANQAGAPTYTETLNRLLTRWLPRFPARVVPAASAPPDTTARTSLVIVIDDEAGIRAALREAHASLARDEVPVGCVVVHDGLVIGRGHNQVEALQDATAHAEILAIGAASNALGSWRLHECTLYVTLEPCSMCAGAIVLARLGRLVYGAGDPKAGGCGSVTDVTGEPRLNHRVAITRGILAEECGELLREFFRRKRKAALRLADADGARPLPDGDA